MALEELNHLKCLETENLLLIKHNKDLLRVNQILNERVLQLEIRQSKNNTNRRSKGKPHNI